MVLGKYTYQGAGMDRSYENDMWTVGIKNYKVQSDIKFFNCLERHLQTDEIFIPITKGNVLVYLEENSSGAEYFRTEPLLMGTVYCVPRGMWHNVIMKEQDKIILVERRGTSYENSEEKNLTTKQKKELSDKITA